MSKQVDIYTKFGKKIHTFGGPHTETVTSVDKDFASNGCGRLTKTKINFAFKPMAVITGDVVIIEWETRI